MKSWEIIREEASVVLVGSFNPSIFHPEWFINKNLVESWEYSDDEKIACLNDLAQIEFPGDKRIEVYLNKFTSRSTSASEFLALKDLVVNTFTILAETPIVQMGMNYTCVIKIKDKETWTKFGRELAPSNHWKDAANYLKDKKDEDLGIWELTMHLPRPDDLPGYIHPNLKVISSKNFSLSFSINNHIDINRDQDQCMATLLEKNWSTSLEMANELISNIMNSQIGDEK